ncbi:MAG: tetratricopeptide repeat protein [Fusobacteriaceae bacterium]
MENLKNESNTLSPFAVKNSVDEMKNSVDLILKQIEDLEKQRGEISTKVLEAEKQLEADKAATEYANKKLETTKMTLELMKQEAETKRLEQESLRSKYLEGQTKYEQSKSKYERDLLERRNKNLEADRKRYFLELKNLEDRWRRLLFGGIALVTIVLGVVIFLFYNRFISPSKGTSILKSANSISIFSSENNPMRKLLPGKKSTPATKNVQQDNNGNPIVPKDSLFSSNDGAYSENNFKLIFDNGLEKYSSGNMEGAIDDFTRAIQIKPNSFDAYYNRGLAKYLKSNFDGAISDFEKAIEINPYSKEAEIAKVKAENKKSLVQQNNSADNNTAGFTTEDITGEQPKKRK